MSFSCESHEKHFLVGETSFRFAALFLLASCLIDDHVLVGLLPGDVEDEELLCPEFELDLSSIFSTLVFFTLAQVFNPLC
jgi:hypothetical protein